MSRRWWVVAAFAMLSGCQKDHSEKPELYAPVAATRQEKLGMPARPEADGPQVAESAQPPAPKPETSTELTVGMSRDALMDALGECAQRIAFEPGNGHGTLSVEVFQPKQGACVEKFKPRRFTVKGGAVSAIEQGLDEAVNTPPPAVPRSFARGEGI